MTKPDRPETPDWVSVTRITLDRLDELVGLVLKWTPAINLVSKASASQIWSRHVYDSMQILPLAPANTLRWLDLGSGAGFPGLVVAIMAKDSHPDLQVTLVEADARKATFLGQAVRLLDLRAVVLAQRIESLPPHGAEVISARALGPLNDLCGHAHRHLGPGGVALFPKGAQAEDEIRQARKLWQFDVTPHQSLTDAAGSILAVKDIHHV